MAKEKPKSTEERPYVPGGSRYPWYSAQFFTAELRDEDEPSGIGLWEIVAIAVVLAAIVWWLAE
jgi:hypothetical protein